MTNHKNKTGKTCTGFMHNRTPCNKPLHDNKHCIFHSNDIEGKKPGFNREFWQELARQEEEEELYDFTGFIFPEEISFEGTRFEKKVYFHDAQFYGKVKFSKVQFQEDTSFLESRFHGPAVFWNTLFTAAADVDFSGAKFNESVDFRQAEFAGDATFAKTQLGNTQAPNRVDFEGSKFKKSSDFRQANFAGETLFRGTQFIGDTGFGEAHFFKKADFRKASFSGEADFIETQFKEKAKFWEATFSKKINFTGAQFSAETNFNNTQFLGVTIFNQAKFYELTSFEHVNFQEGEKCSIEETYFYDISGLLELIEEDNQNRKKKENLKFKYSQKTEFLPDEIRLILGEKAAAKYPLIDRKIRDDMFLLRFKDKYPLLYKLWWLFADCGRGFFKWGMWCMGMAVFFGVLYLLLHLLIDPSPFKPREGGYTWFSFFYYSFVTYTTLGFGDITPIKWYSELLVTIEVILGYGSLGLLISIMANKLARRS
jgi:uncharacterized protein YjbI with pentapeptide repeats